MPNDSTTAGFLVPVGAVPTHDRALEDLIQVAIAGITGLPTALVRPRYQQVVPNQPDFETNWCAFGVSVSGQDTFAYQRHVPSLVSGGDSVVERDEFLDILTSFYGANNNQFMARWRDGLSIDQNRAQLASYGIKLIGLGTPVPVPALLKNQWTRRVDLTCQFARRVSTTFGIRSIQSAEVILDTEDQSTVITVNQ